MDEQHTLHSSDQTDEQSQMVITLELDSTEREGDPALVFAVGNTIVMDLQQEQYVLRQPYTGQKGGFLVQFVVPIAQFILQHHAEVIGEVGGLVGIFSNSIPVLQKVQQAYRKLVGKEESEHNPLKIDIEIDGVPIHIEASDITQAEAALKLALRFHSLHPGAKPTPQSAITVRSQIPSRKRPHRR
jgi:hypothetical protein